MKYRLAFALEMIAVVGSLLVGVDHGAFLGLRDAAAAIQDVSIGLGLLGGAIVGVDVVSWGIVRIKKVIQKAITGCVKETLEEVVSELDEAKKTGLPLPVFDPFAGEGVAPAVARYVVDLFDASAPERDGFIERRAKQAITWLFQPVEETSPASFVSKSLPEHVTATPPVVPLSDQDEQEQALKEIADFLLEDIQRQDETCSVEKFQTLCQGIQLLYDEKVSFDLHPLEKALFALGEKMEAILREEQEEDLSGRESSTPRSSDVDFLLEDIQRQDETCSVEKFQALCQRVQLLYDEKVSFDLHPLEKALFALGEKMGAILREEQEEDLSGSESSTPRSLDVDSAPPELPSVYEQVKFVGRIAGGYVSSFWS